MDELIQRLRTLPELKVRDAEQSWQLRLPARGSLYGVIDLPHHVLEWYVSAFDVQSDAEVWEDYEDYESDEPPVDRPSLVKQLCADVEHFVAGWLAADAVRVVKGLEDAGLEQTTAEWRRNGVWTEVELVAPHP